MTQGNHCVLIGQSGDGCMSIIPNGTTLANSDIGVMGSYDVVNNMVPEKYVVQDAIKTKQYEGVAKTLIDLHGKNKLAARYVMDDCENSYIDHLPAVLEALLNKKAHAVIDDVQLRQRVLAIQKKTLGEDHERVAASYRELALVYTKLETHDKAEEMRQKAAAIRAKK